MLTLDIARPVPLSQGQLSIWIAQMLDRDDPCYNIGEGVEIHGAVDTILFERALRSAVASADALHLRVLETEEGPRQHFRYDPGWELVQRDFTGEPDPEAAARAWMLADMGRPFRLDAEPLFRFALLRTGAERFHWYAVNHHIVNDGVGWKILFRRVESAYTALAAGSPCPVEAGSSWINLLEEEAAYAVSEHRARDRAYWMRQLETAPSPVTLSGAPLARPGRFISATGWIPHAISLEAVAKRYGASPAAIVIAATAIYLQRMTGAEEITLGMPVAARLGPVARSAVGMAANSLPLRLVLRPADRLQDVIAQTMRRLREAIRHQRYRMEDIRRDLGLTPKDPDICGTFVNYTPFDDRSTFANWRIVRHPLGNWRVEDLSVVFYGGNHVDGQLVNMAANPDRYSRAQLGSHLDRFIHVVAEIAEADPEAQLGHLSFLPPAEVAAAVASCNGPAVPVPEVALPALLEAQARTKPDAPALLARGRMWTFAQLNAAANRLARLLIARGIGPDDRVGMIVPRSPEMVVAVLGVLKSGAAYVPIDPEYPAARIAYMLADCRPALVIATATTERHLPEAAARLLVDAGAALGEVPDRSLEDVADWERTRPLSPDDPANVIYTSGSTGDPKGVVGLHRGLVNRLLWMAATFPYDPVRPTLARTSLSFIDGSTELLGPLIAGAPVVLAEAEEAGNPAALSELIERHGVGRLTLVPSLLAAMLEEGQASRLAACGTWITSGAALPPALCRRFHELLPAARLLNLYGATEASGDSLFHLCSPDDAVVGRPLWNTRAYVLNEALQPVPNGAPGFLYLAGIGLAAGYLGREEATAEAFLPDPWSPDGQGRMYRTGDRVRRRDDGALEFIGRVDDQIKLNGIRIELGEVEAALRGAAGVREAAAIRLCDGAQAQRLAVVYTVEPGGAAPAPEHLAAHMARRLPAAMVPAHFIPVAAMPRLPNGKLDRRALARNDLEAKPRVEQLPAPLRTPTELTLGEIWSEVLRRPIANRFDDFFAEGGDSLLATQVISRVSKVFGLELPLRTMFEARSLEALAGRIDAAKGGARQMRQLPPIEPFTGSGPAPLSFSQQRMWLIQSLDPKSTAYNMTGAVRVAGALDAAALRAALDELIRRHEMLRTTYHLVDGEVAQRLEPWQHVPVRLVDLSGSSLDPFTAAVRQAGVRASTPIDLARGPILAADVMRLGPEDHLVQLTLHHIAGDQWSVGVLGRELARIYNAKKAGAAPRLPPLPISYRDFSAWQRQWLEAEEFAPQLAYWRRQLAGLQPLDLPIDRPRPRVQTLNGSFCHLALPDGLIERLELVGRREASTLFMTMLAAFAVLLGRLSGQTDVAVGVPVANRTESSIEPLVGTFVNTLVMRIDLSGEPSFSEVVRRVKATALDAFAHQDVPFDRLVQDLSSTRDPSRGPLAQVLFNMQNAPMHGIVLDGISWQPVAIDRGGSQFELSFSIDPQISRSISVEYNSDLFEKATVERMIGRYLAVLESAMAEPARRVAELDLLPKAELTLLVERFNATAAPLPVRPFIAMFEARSVQHPDAPAASYDGVTLSYAELDRRATALARTLRSQGVGPGIRVGLFLERSLEMLVALLGVQKSGGAYVPLDPGLPPRRLDYLVQDSGIGVLLCRGPGVPDLDLAGSTTLLDIETAASEAAAGPVDPLDGLPRPDDPAYVIYTSGSTGRPKGVVVSHGALANFLVSMRDEPGLGAGDVLAAVTTMSFDIAGLELYLPLLVGARIEIVSAATANDGRALADLLGQRGVTVMQATPSTWRLLIEAGWRGGPGFRALCGGEPLDPELAEALRRRVGGLWNLYGPTETTIWSTVCRVEPGDVPISIGRPIANTQIYVLNGTTPAPLGVAGEICIGGAGLAIGYHGRPDLTAERFVPDPFKPGTHARLYRTGDLGRWGGDGRLYHLGRLDHQVKIRGYRIELGEIESVLMSHPEVRQAVVRAHQIGPGDHRLAAYVVNTPDAEATVSELRRYLRERLPDYMVPAILVPLDRIPLTPNGKIDRAALPDPFAGTRPGGFDRTAEPAPGVETMLARLWQDLLKVDRIGAHDNFFDLGGHSLLALRVVVEIEQRTGTRIDPRALFFQSLRQIAAGLPPVG